MLSCKTAELIVPDTYLSACLHTVLAFHGSNPKLACMVAPGPIYGEVYA